MILTGNIIISTASFCLWDISLEEKLRYCSELGFKRVQIAMSTIKMLKDLCENKKSIPELELFEEVSLHSPWCGFKYGENKKTKRVLEYLKQIDNTLPIDRYIFNYDSILDIDSLKSCNFKMILRNPLRSESWKLFSSNIIDKNISCAFDINRASRSENSLVKMMDEVEDRVSQIHISGFLNNQNRMPIVSTEQYHLLKYLKKFDASNTSIVIEGLFDKDDLYSIDKERQLILEYSKK